MKFAIMTREGTNDVKSARKRVLIQEYELFRMLKGETITEVDKIFTYIVNHLIGLGKILERNGTSNSSNAWTS